MSPERVQEISDAVTAWEQEFRRGIDDQWRPICERLAEAMRDNVTDDDIFVDLLGDRILLQFERDTGIGVEELAEWYTQTDPDHR